MLQGLLCVPAVQWAAPSPAASSESASGLAALLEPGAQVRHPGVAWSIGKRSKQLYYPDWLEGTWQAEASLDKVANPLGRRFVTRSTPGVTKASMLAALPDVGAGMDGRTVRFQMRFVRRVEEGGVVADRPFNLAQLDNAFLGYEAVTSVMYNPLENPTRLSITYTTPRKDTAAQSNDIRKAEIFVNNRTSELDRGTFTALETFRQVNQAKQQGAVFDYAVISQFRQQPDAPDHIAVRQRTAAFLTPQDPLFFDAGAKAVGLYDYTLKLARSG